MASNLASEQAKPSAREKPSDCVSSTNSTYEYSHQSAVGGLHHRTYKSVDEFLSNENVVGKSKNETLFVRPFDLVPNEIAVKIFAYLDPFSVKRVSGVSRRFRNLITEYEDKLQKIVFKRVEVEFCHRGAVKVLLITLQLRSIDSTIKSKEFRIEKSKDACEGIKFVKSTRASQESSFVVKDPVGDLPKVLEVLLRNSIVKKLIFFQINFNSDFCDKMVTDLKLSSAIKWVVFCGGGLYDISCECFGRFIALFGAFCIGIRCVSYQESDPNPERGNGFIMKVIEMNPQLQGICVSGLNWITKYDQIFPIHIFENVATALDDVVMAVKEWTLGNRKIIELCSRLIPHVTLERFLIMTGAVVLQQPASKIGYSTIVNTRGERLFLKIEDSRQIHLCDEL